MGLRKLVLLTIASLGVCGAHAVTIPVSFEELNDEPPVDLGLVELENPSGTRAQVIEGWVLLAFTIRADGSTDDVQVIEQSIEGVFEEAATRWAAESRYEPAKRNGEPVDARALRRAFFYYEGQTNTVSGLFQRRTVAATRALAKGDYDKAWDRIEKLSDRRHMKLAEGCFLDLLKSVYFEKQGDLDQALAHAERALIVSELAVDPASHEQLLRHAIGLQARTGQLAAALENHAALVELRGGLSANDPAQVVAEQVQAVIDSDSSLTVDAQLTACTTCLPEGGSYRWQHQLARQQFQFHALEGPLAVARLKCDGRVAEFLPIPETTYELPVGAERCLLRVSAEVPVTFRFLELPAATPMVQASP